MSPAGSAAIRSATSRIRTRRSWSACSTAKALPEPGSGICLAPSIGIRSRPIARCTPPSRRLPVCCFPRRSCVPIGRDGRRCCVTRSMPGRPRCERIRPSGGSGRAIRRWLSSHLHAGRPGSHCTSRSVSRTSGNGIPWMPPAMYPPRPCGRWRGWPARGASSWSPVPVAS